MFKLAALPGGVTERSMTDCAEHVVTAFAFVNDVATAGTRAGFAHDGLNRRAFFWIAGMGCCAWCLRIDRLATVIAAHEAAHIAL